MKVVLFDLGKTLQDQDVLLPGARETLQAIQEMRDQSGEAVALALVSDFDMPDDPEQIPSIRQQYYEILEGLSIRSLFEPVADRVTLSSEVGVFKPDEKIFRAVIEKINKNLSFGDVVFVTENREHVIEARRLGMSAIHVKGPGQNAGDVDRLVDVIPLVQELLGLRTNGGNRTSAESSSPSSEQEKDRPPLESDLLPWDEIQRRYPLSSAANRVMMRARRLAEGLSAPVPAVTSSLLLFAMIEEGRSSGASGSPGFLWNYIRERGEVGDYEDVRSSYLRSRGIRDDAAEQAFEAVGSTTRDVDLPQYATRNTRTVLEKASILRQQLDEAEVRRRYLLAGLLADRPDGISQGAHRRLQEMGIDRLALRMALLSQMVPSTGEQEHVWEEFLLGEDSDLRRLSGYAADTTRGSDLLGISRDVDAFATLIAAKSVRPPLAIGLFGEWGSGKTFFMNQLRAAVDALAQDMNATNQMQRDLPFYKRIVQIEFNAWTYMQGELWPSLMQHLLDNLRLPGERKSASQELRNHLIQELQKESTALEDARRGVEGAAAEIKRAEEEASSTREKLQEKEKELEETSKLIDAQNFPLTEIKPDVDALLTALGMAHVSAAARDLGNALQEARGVLQNGNAVLTPLVRAEDRGRRLWILLLGLLVAPLVGFLAGLIPALLGKEAIAQITTLATGAATLIGALTVWLRLQATWLKERIDKADEVQRRYDGRVAEVLANYREQLRQQERELSRLDDSLAAAERKKENAERRVAVAREQLDQATTTNLLADYIQDRAASQDYRKHLGVLALIRNDFEKLSNLMEEENWRQAPTSAGDDELSYKVNKYATLEDEKKGETKRINRIVLYIDDLDRCPPNVVTDVLQAVHLLLAFPLFVVVVAVDARWIKRSLRARYEELLHTGGREPKEDERNKIFGQATPDDYLEKIFQVPFWLNPIGQDASSQMVKGLLQDSLTDIEPAEATDGAMRQQQVEGEPRRPADELGEASITTVPDDQSTTQPNDATPELAEPAVDRVKEAETYINPTRLQITPSEMEFITQLAPLLGRSPRALKRFVNVYRLIKAGLSQQEDRHFLMESTLLDDYQAVLFLLAVDTGLPYIAQEFFDGLQSTPDRKSLRALIEEHLDKVDSQGAEEWSRLRKWLMQVNAIDDEERPPRLPEDVKSLAAWKHRVLRYSFRADQA